MIRFRLDDFQTEFPNWAKHHKQLGLRVKRIKPNGDVVLSKSDKIKALIDKYENKLRPKPVSFYNEESGGLEHGTDYFLMINNLDYEETNLEHYSVGAMNTKQTTHVRMTFLLDSDKVILEHKYDSEGSFAMSFYDIISSMDSVKDIIDDILEKELPLEETGISEGDEKDCYKVVLVTPVGEFLDADIPKRELLNSLVNVEVYKFEQEITD